MGVGGTMLQIYAVTSFDCMDVSNLAAAMRSIERSSGKDGETMSEDANTRSLLSSVQRYFNLMYDCDVSVFDTVFRPSAQLHGFRDGEMTMWPVQAYKDILSKRQSPKSQNAPREDEILLVDFASDTQALVKAKVRIGAMSFTDYLVFHRIGNDWLITSKAYHVNGAK
jgi:hypothetical protein